MVKRSLLKNAGKWAPVLGFMWVASHIAVPLLILRIPVAHDFLITLESKLPFEIPGIV